MRFRFALPLLLTALLAACAPRTQDPGPLAETPMPPSLTQTHFITPDGTRLPLRRWLPETTPHAVIVTLHGFNDYSNAFAEIGPRLAENGIATIAYDQRGFGASDQAGDWPGGDRLRDDVRAAIEAVHTAYPGARVYAMGESMGGAVLMSAWADAALETEGLILVAPAVWGRVTMPFYQSMSLWLFAHTMPWLPLSGQGIKRNPSDNIEMLRALGKDPLVIKNTRVDSIWGIVNLMDEALEAAAGFDAPALLLYGANDDIVPPEASRQMIANLPDAPDSQRRIAIYEDGYHMLLRDLQGDVVLRDILTWIKDPARDLPSGADKGDPHLRFTKR
ncbi:MAG: alpha/beta hydrolase [Rhodospirillaceae bacterium]|jgi:acylglycerol lipase|nr:alpha/beta hydrolase [Rhodospirillaceae bacterium]